MDINLGLGLAGSIMNKPIKKDIDINDRIKNIPQYSDNIYSNEQIFNNREKVYKQFNKNFSNSFDINHIISDFYYFNFHLQSISHQSLSTSMNSPSCNIPQPLAAK